MKYKVLFNNGGIPMTMTFKTKKEVENFKKDFNVLEVTEVKE